MTQNSNHYVGKKQDGFMSVFLENKMVHLEALIQEAYFIKKQIDRHDLPENQKKSLLHNDRKQLIADLRHLVSLVSRNNHGQE